MVPPAIDPAIADKVVGVMDLKAGQCVHAIGGRRDDYRPIACVDGDPLALMDRYRRWGVNRLYIADLDAITGGTADRRTIERIIGFVGDDPRAELWIDAGLAIVSGLPRGRWFRDGRLRWIVATEMGDRPESLFQWVNQLGDGSRLAVCLDFHASNFRGCGCPDDWLDAAAASGIESIIVLDTAEVGCDRGLASLASVKPALRLASTRLPDATLVSGGGLDGWLGAAAWFDAGVDRLLVGSLLQRDPDDRATCSTPTLGPEV